MQMIDVAHCRSRVHPTLDPSPEGRESAPSVKGRRPLPHLMRSSTDT